MKTKFILLFIALITLYSVGSAQEYDDNDMQYDPIHATIIPSTLNIEETYTKANSVYFSGDDIVFNVIKPYNILIKNSYKEFPSINFKLPVNPRQNYDIQFNFTCPKFSKTTTIALTLGTLLVTISKNNYDIIDLADGQSAVSSQKKWNIPNGAEKDLISLKIERKGKIITIFANDSYLGEVNASKDIMREMNCQINFISQVKNSFLYFNSLKIDQGAEITE